ncbi:MAG: FkbM family methyltransferase [Nitrososphaeria archaeon]|nr:FkbM family methyltransferase [Nitrososphaeria archaeon]
MTIDSDTSQGYTSFQLKEQKNGTRIQTITLANILDRFELNDALLKLDCEGCEYNVILNSDTKTLLKFKTILIEFHNGFENIKNKLEISGFEIKQLISLKPTKGYLLAQKSN